MRYARMFLGLAALAAAAGCQSPYPREERTAEFNAWTVDEVTDPSIRKAVVTQRTLYPYHFVDGAAALTDLGRRDVSILAEHLRDSPGPLNVRQGSASDELYRARVQTVRAELERAGVTLAGVNVQDGMPGGPGVSSRRAVLVLDRADERQRIGSGDAEATSTTVRSGGR